MNGITYGIKIIEPPSTLEHKSRAEEIKELEDFIKIVTDASENLAVLYVSATEPDVNNRDKIWLKTDYSSGMVPGLYRYENNAWVLKSKTEIIVAENPPADKVNGTIWLCTGSDDYVKGIYYYDNGWKEFAKLAIPITFDTTPPKYQALWINTNLDDMPTSNGLASTLFYNKDGIYSNPALWLNLTANMFQRGIYEASEPPSDAYIRRNFKTLGGMYAYPFWSNVGLSNGTYPESIYRFYNNRWESIFAITYKKVFANISLPTGMGSITLSYKTDETDYFCETPYLLTQLYNDNEAAALRWAVRPKAGLEKSKFECLYYNAGTSSRIIDMLLIAVGKVAVPKVN